MYQIPYYRETLRPISDVIPGNSEADNPVEFDLSPAWGADLARIKSLVYASLGLVSDTGWTPEIQAAVIAAFETGAPAFINTIEAIRGLTIPAAMAVRAGLLAEIPTSVKPGDSGPTPDYNAPVPVTTGRQFSLICGSVTPMALHVAMKVSELSQRAQVDPRFFVQPSGSGGPGTPGRKATTAGNAARRSKKSGTVASISPAAAK